MKQLLLSSFCILHSAFCIHGQLPSFSPHTFDSRRPGMSGTVPT
jgi:hypothetical protein